MISHIRYCYKALDDRMKARSYDFGTYHTKRVSSENSGEPALMRSLAVGFAASILNVLKNTNGETNY